MLFPPQPQPCYNLAYMIEKHPFNNSTSKSKEERAPFVIRGHHLSIFRELVQGNPQLNDTYPRVVAKVIKDAVISTSQPKYIQDLYGKSSEELENAQKAFMVVLDTFLRLPKNHPVEISAGKKDEICKTCPAVGNHCALRDQSSYGGGKDVLTGDTMWVNRFIRSQTLWSLKKPEVKKEVVSFSDAPPAETKTVLTTAGNTKRVLQKWDYLSDLVFTTKLNLKRKLGPTKPS